jgi:hypothetical protein
MCGRKAVKIHVTVRKEEEKLPDLVNVGLMPEQACDLSLKKDCNSCRYIIIINNNNNNNIRAAAAAAVMFPLAQGTTATYHFSHTII